jgi:hypothetical protein
LSDKQRCPDYLTLGGLTLKISKIREGGVNFTLRFFSDEIFQGWVNFCRFLPWSPFDTFLDEIFQGLHPPPNTPLWASLVISISYKAVIVNKFIYLFLNDWNVLYIKIWNKSKRFRAVHMPQIFKTFIKIFEWKLMHD